MGMVRLLRLGRVEDLLGGGGGGVDDGEKVRMEVRVLMSQAGNVVLQVLRRMEELEEDGDAGKSFDGGGDGEG